LLSNDVPGLSGSNYFWHEGRKHSSAIFSSVDLTRKLLWSAEPVHQRFQQQHGSPASIVCTKTGFQAGRTKPGTAPIISEHMAPAIDAVPDVFKVGAQPDDASARSNDTPADKTKSADHSRH
jgi:hypothetical protein